MVLKFVMELFTFKFGFDAGWNIVNKARARCGTQELLLGVVIVSRCALRLMCLVLREE